MGGGGGVGVGVGGAGGPISAFCLTDPCTVGIFISSIRKIFLPPASYFLFWLAARMSRRNLGSSVLSGSCCAPPGFWGDWVAVCVEVAGAGAGAAAELVLKST